jgi:hypothetical protein
MKRFAFATLAALAAVVASEQEAKAWFNFSLGSQTQMSVSWGGHNKCGNTSEPWPHNVPVPGFNSCPCPQQWGGYGQQGGYVAPMPGAGSGSVGSGSPMSYYYTPAATYGYGYGYTMPNADASVQNAYYQVPPYWYGR